MDGVDNKYIDNAIINLSKTLGIKESVDGRKIIALVHSKKIKEAIKEIANHLGLPIEVKLLYVQKGYRPNATDGFRSTHLVKTDSVGRGSAGITAQVEIPPNLPLYGTPRMENFPITVRVSENCADNPKTFIGVMAHELSHIVLYSSWHAEKENEFYTDLAAMMLGFSNVMKSGRKVIKTSTFYQGLGSRTTMTETTTYGYLSDGNFAFAFKKIKSLLSLYESHKKRLIGEIKKLERSLNKQKKGLALFKQYLAYLDRNLDQKISHDDGQWIYKFHQVGYTDEFESAVKERENDLKEFAAFFANLHSYSSAFPENVQKFETRIKGITTTMSSRYDQLRGALIILKKYVSVSQRFKSFLEVGLYEAN